MVKQMYKKSLFFNGKAVYDYVYNNTKVKNIVFGYFLSPSEKFYGQLNDAEINVYYSDITLNCFNPKITIKKDEKDNTVINVHYNSFHYFLIVLMLLIATIVSIAGLNFPTNLIVAFLFDFILLFIFKINFNWQLNKISECFDSVCH